MIGAALVHQMIVTRETYCEHLHDMHNVRTMQQSAEVPEAWRSSARLTTKTGKGGTARVSQEKKKHCGCRSRGADQHSRCIQCMQVLISRVLS